jgi:Zn-dependent peptidase ImmA (M78 family)/transcriptional regulator with XRE-family HTH domain
MANDKIPINPEVLKWARQRSGFTYEDLSNQFKKLKDWEEGISMPTYKQLEDLSDKFKCPVAVFFFPEPPNIEPIRNSFRTLPDIDYELIPPVVRLLLQKAKSMQINLEELNEQSPLYENSLLKDLNFDINIPLEDIAAKVRKYLNVPLSRQIAWTNVEHAFEQWRHILSVHGLFVFKDAFRADEYSGFCLYHSDFPIIYINNSTSKNRQIFTLFHELAHLIFKTSGIDKLNSGYLGNLNNEQKKIEALCNKFASVFLVPDDSFKSLIQDVELNEEGVKTLSQAYKVSPEVILRKLYDKDKISQNDYEDQVASLNKRYEDYKSRKAKGGDFYNTQIAYLGKDYVNIAFKQYFQNKINSTKLADYLNIAPKNLDKFQDKFLM